MVVSDYWLLTIEHWACCRIACSLVACSLVSRCLLARLLIDGGGLAGGDEEDGWFVNASSGHFQVFPFFPFVSLSFPFFPFLFLFFYTGLWYKMRRALLWDKIAWRFSCKTCEDDDFYLCTAENGFFTWWVVVIEITRVENSKWTAIIIKIFINNSVSHWLHLAFACYSIINNIYETNSTAYWTILAW